MKYITAEIIVAGILIAIGIVLMASFLGLTFYGLYLAFSVSVLVGLVWLLFEPLPLVTAIVYLATGKNLALMFAVAIGLA